MRKVVWILVLVLAVLHQDFWLWDSKTLVLGFIPVGLAYHACFSLSAAFVWFLALRFAWPGEIEAWAEESDGGDA